MWLRNIDCKKCFFPECVSRADGEKEKDHSQLVREAIKQKERAFRAQSLVKQRGRRERERSPPSIYIFTLLRARAEWVGMRNSTVEKLVTSTTTYTTVAVESWSRVRNLSIHQTLPLSRIMLSGDWKDLPKNGEGKRGVSCVCGTQVSLAISAIGRERERVIMHNQAMLHTCEPNVTRPKKSPFLRPSISAFPK